MRLIYNIRVYYIRVYIYLLIHTFRYILIERFEGKINKNLNARRI